MDTSCQHLGLPDPDECGSICKVARPNECLSDGTPADADSYCLGYPGWPEQCYRWQRERADTKDLEA